MMSQWLWHKWGKERQPGILGSSFAPTALVFRSRTKGFVLLLLVFMFCHLKWWSVTRFCLHTPEDVCCQRALHRILSNALEPPCRMFSSGCPVRGSALAKGYRPDGVLPCGIVLSPVCFCFSKGVCKMWLLDICGRLNWILYIFQAFFNFLFRKPLVIKPCVA